MPKLSKEELRARVDLLERTVATLRTKNREFRAAAKAATGRVAELELELAQRPHGAAAEKPRRTRRPREIDPGDAVPPGVAVLDPEPMDAEARAAHDALEEHLSHEPSASGGRED